MRTSSRALLPALLVALVLPAVGPAPAEGQFWRREARQAIPQDPGVLVGTLENGLTYYIRGNAEPPNRAELRLVVNAGSVLEDEDQRGLAHLVEHMAFNGTRNFAKQELVDYLESVGMRFGPDVNAYTSFDETVYMLTLPTDRPGVLETGIQILEDWAHGVEFEPEEVEKERKVVIEEWRLGQGAGSRMRDRQFPVLARGSRYAERMPIGTYESLTRFDHEAARRFYRDWYRPDLMAVVAVGDFDVAWMESLIRDHFSRIEAPGRPRHRREFTIPQHRETLVSVVTDAEATGSSISLYLKRQPRQWTTARSYRDWIVESLASSMLTNRLSEFTQRPDSPFLDVSSFHGRFIRPLAAYVLNVRVPDRAVEPGLDALISEAERASRHGFTESELRREQREMLRIMEQRWVERAKTTSSSFAADYVSHFLYGGMLVDIDTENELYQRFIPEIRLREVNTQAREWMRDRNRVVLVTAPERPGIAVPSEDRLRERLLAVSRRPLRAYVDDVSDAPLVANPPTPAPIVSEERLEELGITRWELANGVKVVLKPTDFREDEVLLAAYSPGGSSLVPDSSFLHALTAPAVVQAGGLGDLSAIDLRKRLAGRVAGVGADIGDMHEGLSGAASPTDLDLLFQLVYLKFTAPRVDTSAFLAYQEQARASLENRSANPETVFSDSLRVILTQNHPRARPPSSAMFDDLDMHRSFEIYRDRFADASDFTFYLVGNFQVDSIRPLVQRYLGGLPSTGREEAGRDLGIGPPAGVVERVVRRGVEPKAMTQIVFTGPFEFSRDNLFLLSAFSDVLRLRLREVLREDLGGTYGVDVRASGLPGPRPRYQISIGFGADPERLEDLVAVVFAELDRLEREGPRGGDLAKVREMQLRSRELEVRRNHFWVSQLLAHDRYGWDPREILRYEDWIDSLRGEQIREVAERYLDRGNYVRVSLYPEEAAVATPEPEQR
jgi:zinc protease